MTFAEQMTEIVEEAKKNNKLGTICKESGISRGTVRRICAGNTTIYSAETLAKALGKKLVLVDIDG